MACGGSSAPAAPSTTTTIQDIPAWEQGYVTNLLGQAQTEAAQPYQQFPGQQVAGFTPDQTQAFTNVEGQQANINPLQTAATGQTAAGANTANNIYGAASPLVNASTQAATPQGIQAYMSPYLNNDISGLQTLAQQNWNEFTAPSVNNSFVSAGQSGSGRNEQVLGQQANLANQALTAQISGAEQNAYSTAGTQAATEAGLLGSAGSTLGNLASTQAGQQLNAGTNLQNLATSQNQNALTNNQALQAVGQEQQQLNQANLTTAQQNWENQVQYPEAQTSFLNNIVRGLPAPTATTSSAQLPATTVSPLSGVGGAGIGALAVTGASGNPLATTTPAVKKGGLIKGYADGGMVDEDDPDNLMNESFVPSSPLSADSVNADPNATAEMIANRGTGQSAPPPQPTPAPQTASPLATPQPEQEPSDEPSMALRMADAEATPDHKQNPLATGAKNPSAMGISQSQMQQMQLLELARGMLTPQPMGNVAAGVGQGLGNLSDYTTKAMEFNAQQNALNYQRQQEQEKIDLQRQTVEQGRYQPVKDFYGNVTGMVEGKTGKFTPVNSAQPGGGLPVAGANEAPSADPQKAAAQILAEQGTVPTQVGNKFDIAGRNKQVDAYNNAQLAAKSTIQQLDALNAQTGKYTPGKAANIGYGSAAALGIDPTGGATARAEADKASKALANSFMQANVGAKGSGIRMVQFDAGAVPNADMPDAARTDLINKNKAIANSQIQRAVISNLYPRMQMSNVNAIMDNYEQKNPPVLPSGSANPNWMPYQDWLKAGRPDTTSAPSKSSGGGNGSGKVMTQADIDETAAKSGKTADEVRKAAINKGYTIQ